MSVHPENPEVGNYYLYRTYGPGGLFWPYGGSGVLVSAALVENVVGGATGWGRCARTFIYASTDIQVTDRGYQKSYNFVMIIFPDE